MSKAIVRIDIPTDYADEYKQWIIDGRLCYLEDGAWTFFKEVEYKVEPYKETIPVEWIKSYVQKPISVADYWAVVRMVLEWEKENGK